MQYVHFGELGSSSTSDLGHTELGQFIFQIVQLLKQFLLLLASQISCLDLGLYVTGETLVTAYT